MQFTVDYAPDYGVCDPNSIVWVAPTYSGSFWATITPAFDSTYNYAFSHTGDDPDPGEASDVYYTVMYNYNTDYKEEYSDTENLNEPIMFNVDPRQRIFMTSYSESTILFSALLNGANIDSQSLASDVFINYGINLAELTLNVGDKIVLSDSIASFEYKVVRPCRNRYALYYVNKYGGLDSFLFEGRVIESYNPSNIDVSLYNDRGNRQDWEQKRIYREIDKQYELHSGFVVSDEYSRRIDNLKNAVKVWIHDLEMDTVTSCLIIDSTFRVEEKRYSGMIQYTVNVKESQKQIRR